MNLNVDISGKLEISKDIEKELTELFSHLVMKKSVDFFTDDVPDRFRIVIGRSGIPELDNIIKKTKNEKIQKLLLDIRSILINNVLDINISFIIMSIDE